MGSLRTKRLSAVLAAGFALVSACSASGPSGTSGVRGASGNGSSSGGAGNGTGITGDGNTGNLITSNNGGNNGTDAGCQQYAVNFVPKIPTVFVLVDRSGSMFSGSSPPWEPLKTGALNVIQQLQADVAFGWGAFTGTKSTSPIQCPVFVGIDPALNNYSAINGQYSGLGALPNGEKAETPVGEALDLVQQSLAKTPVDGDKYILFVTDGEPDFCDDGDADCPLDDVVYRLQSLKTQGITTIIFGLQNSSVAPTTLQSFANAGAGAPVALPFKGTAQDVYYACSGVQGWMAEATAAGKTGMDILGTYGDTGGTTKYYQPDPADQTALTTQLQSVLAGVKSCTFDLGGKISVDLTQLNLASVAIQGNTIPLDTTNGWTMTTNDQLTLVGSACDTWRKPETTMIDFNFPCEIIVPK